MSIWHLTSLATTKLTLWRINETQFRVTRFDAATPVLSNPGYVLLDKKFEPVLNQLKGQLTWTAVSIHDLLRSITWENFFDLKIQNHIDRKTLNKVDADGFKIWVYAERFVFVSQAVKTELEKLDTGTLKFVDALVYFNTKS